MSTGRAAHVGLAPVGEVLRSAVPGRDIDPDRGKGWIRRVLPVVRAHRGLLVVATVSGVVMVGAKVLVPRWVGYALNEALARPAGARATLTSYLWVLGAITVVGLLAGFLQRSYTFRAAFAIEHDLRTLLYRHMIGLSFPFFDRVQSGQLLSRANSDVRALQMLLAFGPAIVVQLGMFVLALYFMVRVHVGLTLLSVTVLPLVYMTGMRLRRSMLPISWLVQARMADVATVVDENLNGIRVIKAFAAEKLQIGALAAAAARLQWAAVLLVRLRARLGPVMENLPRVGEALVLLYGGLLVLDGRIGPGDIVVFLAYLVLLQAPLRMLGFLVMMGQRAAASAQRIYEILDTHPQITDRPGAVDLVDCGGEIEFRDVAFTFTDGPTVLAGLDLHVAAGETVALVGRTGSGKTTIAELIPRFYDVDHGAVLVDGHDVRDLTVASLRSQIGFCFDEPFLFSMSVRDNIAYGRPDASHDEVVAAARVAGAHEFITDLAYGYDTIVGERGYSLSGGQRQRLSIARTLLANPQILILDDATSAVDVNVERTIHQGLGRLLEDRTTLIIAHRLSTIGLADRVVLVDDGRVVASGGHRELLASEPRYAQVLAHLSEDNARKADVVQQHAEPIPDMPIEVLRPLDPDQEMR